MYGEKSQKDLEAGIKSYSEFGRKGAHWKNYQIGLKIFREETGHYGDDVHLAHYDLDDATRTRLLAHGRQDIAHALCNTKSILDAIAVLRREVSFYGLIIIALLGSIGWKLWH